ncbi:MAG: hypothetical protein HYU66_18395 [Armatimonadetes bacterium]|nr:hypothetical protein [Armatimonadota bacterium]
MLGCLSLAVAQDDPKAAFLPVRDQIKQAREQGQFEQAIALAEGYLQQFPAVMPYSRNCAVAVEAILSRELTDPAKRLVVYQRAVKEFTTSPDYYALGAAGLARDAMFGHKDPGKAEAILDEATRLLGDKLDGTYYLQFNLLLLRMHAKLAANHPDQALAAAKEAVERSPWMLSDKWFLSGLVSVAQKLDAQDPKPQRTLGAAKLFYVLCAYDDKAIQEAVSACADALAAGSGPGAALQMGRSHKDPTVTSPLKPIKTLEFADLEAMQKTAGADLDAQLNIYLYSGRYAEAVATAKFALQRASTRGKAAVEAALKGMARCFKAYDLNGVRAEQYLNFNATGAGEDPLPALLEDLGVP